MASSKGICILGSTGTIGVNTLDVISRHPDRFHVVALTGHNNSELLLQQCRENEPEVVAVTDADVAEKIERQIRAAGLDIKVLCGVKGLEQVAALPQVDYVMAAIVGAAGLLPTLAAARAGKRVLLANKEALVMSGALFMSEVRDHGAELLPIDSEHNAIFQCMPDNYHTGQGAVGVEKILLTASGGPFREYGPEQLASVTPEQAIAHPNWVMGRKISVDSATMMNKGLELIEAYWLFDVSHEKIQVVIHPQSIIHSMVSYNDGSVLAQMGNPDMRTPIAHALAWPERIQSGVEPLDLFEVAKLDFVEPDFARFPCLALAYESIKLGGTATTALNAANEEAVSAFLDRKLHFTGIAEVIARTLENVSLKDPDALQAVLDADMEARQICREFIKK